MMKQAVLPVVFCLLACNPYKALRSDRVSLPAAGELSLRVPKGFREARTDNEAGGRVVRSYHYNDGTVFYVAYVPDRGDLQPIDHAVHVPGFSSVGDTLFKELGAFERYWREDRKGLLRAGYVNVSKGKPEVLFDSAVNYIRRVNH
ncbi:hypothetical protein EPD60_10425 [Flaviaesturariibacter flavus]|uniref:Uncharacterized protein n=1 Tax=Flaviaesturariibacter flavus TaxID=2502780 RepID=A0A4R1BBT1_9BACT|nr:hypothetical protein [Flaviaesturariibacter flavus]TCJ14398.1 hypothetical protein EPD60_10425 [Flaviaesturariibacter flavus]